MFNHVLAIFLGGLPILFIQIIFMVYVCRKKHYKEVLCKACDGEGAVFLPGPAVKYLTDTITNSKLRIKAMRGDCLCCNGRGTQTVLEKIE